MENTPTYSNWKQDHQGFLETLTGKHVFVLFSGGCDSSLALSLISRAGQEFGFDLEAHGAAFPVHRYTEAEKAKLSTFWNQRGVTIGWHTLAESDKALEEAQDPCLVCQGVRKEMLRDSLPRFVRTWEDLVLVTSFSLWDLASYTMEHLLADLSSTPEQGDAPGKNKRLMETAQRFYPSLKMKEGYTVFRPLIRYNGNDILRQVEKQGIPTLSIPCRYQASRPKRILERYHERMALRLDYERLLAFAKRCLNLPRSSSFTAMEKDRYLGHIF